MRLENSPGTPAITFSNGQESLNLLSYFRHDVISCILVYVISGGSRGGARGEWGGLGGGGRGPRGRKKNFVDRASPYLRIWMIVFIFKSSVME